MEEVVRGIGNREIVDVVEAWKLGMARPGLKTLESFKGPHPRRALGGGDGHLQPNVIWRRFERYAHCAVEHLLAKMVG